MTAWAWCIVGLAIVFTTGISFIHVVIFLALMPAVVIPAFVNSVLASRWVARFYSRMKNRDCVACGYTPGRSSGQLVICPECGIMLPVMEAATTSRGDQP